MASKTAASGKSDIIFQEVKLYIEGVQVPFSSITVSSGIGTLPVATIVIPPQSGLTEITRYYQPKVHIFYVDPVSKEDCILFNGLLTGSQYSKSADGSAYIAFQCEHRNNLMKSVTLEFSGYATDKAASYTDPNLNVSIIPTDLTSTMAIFRALNGVDVNSIGGDTVSDEENIANVSKWEVKTIPAFLEKYKNRYLGMVGVPLVFWNMIKYGIDRPDLSISRFFRIMTKPLVERGIKFFERMGGHYSIEERIHKDKIDPCPDKNSPGPIVVPPLARSFFRSAVQAQLTFQVIHSRLVNSGEQSTFLDLFNMFFNSFEYDILTLTSPAEVPSDPENMTNTESLMSMETIVKPQVPFYYAPLCNVLYPNMVSSISVTQDDSNIPTRITGLFDITGRNEKMGTNFRGPQSIRTAIATRYLSDVSIQGEKTLDIKSTFGSNFGAIGIYEQGKTFKNLKISMPMWLSQYGQARKNDTSSGKEVPFDDEERINIKNLEIAWNKRYAKAKYSTELDSEGIPILLTIDPVLQKLNPWVFDHNLPTFWHLMANTVDYEFSKLVASSRAGTAKCIFNPYIIPGYSMEILESSPILPSYHAYCTAVHHTITSDSISTSVDFVSAMSYTELANYYMPFIHPWLQTHLGFLQNQSILGNDSAKVLADSFYYSTLGVGCAAPDLIYDFNNTGRPLPVIRENQFSSSSKISPFLSKGSSSSSESDKLGRELNPLLSASGSLSLAYRPVETKKRIEEEFKIKFIDLVPGNYNPVVIKYEDEVLKSEDQFEPGRSQFLDYTTSISGPSGQVEVSFMDPPGFPPKESAVTKKQPEQPSATVVTTTSNKDTKTTIINPSTNTEQIVDLSLG